MKLNRVALPTILILLLSALGIGGLCALVRHWENSRAGPLHVFQLPSAPAFLTDDLALARAKETMALDGYSMAIWQPMEDGRTKSPNGSPDIYLSRNSINPNRGTIQFWDPTMKQPNPSRLVVLEMEGDRLECRVIIPK